MAAAVIKRPALGQSAGLGSLYDARSDTFFPLSMLSKTLPTDSVSVLQKHSTELRFSKTNTYNEKFEAFDIGHELGASILAGLVQVEGSARVLTDKRCSSHSVSSSMHYTITTVEEELKLTSCDLKQCINLEAIKDSVATHVVVGVTWGARCVVTAKAEASGSDATNKTLEQIETQLRQLKPENLESSDSVSNNTQDLETVTDKVSNITFYSDVLADDYVVPSDLLSAQFFISNVHRYIENANDGKGKPIIYTLMPISVLAMLRIVEIDTHTISHSLSVECLERYVQFFESFENAQRCLKEYKTQVEKNITVVPPNHIHEITDRIDDARTVEVVLKSTYGKILVGVRDGSFYPQELHQLLENFQKGTCTPKKLDAAREYAEKLDFVKSFVEEGALYVGYMSPSLSKLLAWRNFEDAYILYFNDHLRHQDVSWKENVALLFELIRDTTSPKTVVLVDCQATGEHLEKPFIRHVRNSAVIAEDLLEQRRFLAANCVMRYNEKAIDRSLTSKPPQRRAVKMPCPQPCCDRTLNCNWICSQCQTLVEYGYVDERLYCDCGSCPYDQWEFKCKDTKHGLFWVRCDPVLFLNLLKDLRPFEEMNILILGETGVGKSTWINALVNYLSYDTLEEALSMENLKWVIPCSFSTQLQDKSDGKGSFLQKKIKVGSSKDEHDSAQGESATQLTSVYTMEVNDIRVRLIDTPGIGDTRGVDQDNKNMADILKVLRTYKQLHGILILLKPNASRLTVMFRFCIKQLLTQLHRSTIDNIAFGFTNTRGSNYRPGDTFAPLQALLSDYEEVKIGLFNHNVYCFDSESFRYLCARKNAVDMGHLEENERSWEHSVKECKRLIKHFQGLKPHEVRSTINLNETREVILRLTEPMALISQKIQTSIEVNDDQIKDLHNKELSRQELEQSLYVQKESLESCPVDMPRTVCTHASCVDVRGDFEGRSEKTIIYKTACHKPCYLKDIIPRNEKGNPELQSCWAFSGKEACRVCGHHWMDHMHIYYDYRPLTYQHRDAEVDKSLVKAASKIELQQQAIDMRRTAIEEFRLEYTQVQEAAIQFGFFLKRHAITPYNDATLEYVDHLIDQEKMKIARGAEQKGLINLGEYRAKHVEKVATLTKAMERGDCREIANDIEISQLISSLFGLPHFGKDLKRIVDTNEKTADAVFRERSFNISAGKHWTHQNSRRLKKVSHYRDPTDQNVGYNSARQHFSGTSRAEPSRQIDEIGRTNRRDHSSIGVQSAWNSFTDSLSTFTSRDPRTIGRNWRSWW